MFSIPLPLNVAMAAAFGAEGAARLTVAFGLTIADLATGLAAGVPDDPDEPVLCVPPIAAPIATSTTMTPTTEPMAMRQPFRTPCERCGGGGWNGWYWGGGP